MKLPGKFTALVCCIVLILLAGLGTSLWGQTAGFAYVANSASNDLSAYTIDGITGALTPVAGRCNHGSRNSDNSKGSARTSGTASAVYYMVGNNAFFLIGTQNGASSGPFLFSPQ